MAEKWDSTFWSMRETFYFARKVVLENILKNAKKTKLSFCFLSFFKISTFSSSFHRKCGKKHLKMILFSQVSLVSPGFSWLRVTKSVGRRMVSRNWGRLTRNQRSLIKCLHMKCKQFCKFQDLLLSSLLFRKHAYGLYCCCLCQQSTNIFYPRKKLMTEDFSSYQKLSKREKKFNKHSVCVQTNFRTHELWSLPWADRRWFKRKHIRIRFCDVTFFLLETFFSVTFAEILTMTDRECLLATSSLFIKSNVVVIMARNVQTKLW